MDAPPPPLPSHVVSLLLSYLSRLDDPLPPHLLSTPLRQRHHFLGLGNVLDTADDAAAYLSWPSTSGTELDTLRLGDLLSSLPSPENFDPLVAYPTKYSYDGETVFAHVQVPMDGLGSNDSENATGLRLVFRWEVKDGEGAVQGHEGAATNADNWKYHDARATPYPPNSHDTPQEALQPQAEESTPTQSHPPPSAQLPEKFDSHFLPEQTSEFDEDAYWNSYGRSGSDDEDEGVYDYSRGAASKADDDEKAEEAYWAQYASVHGTADSTRHSPLPPKHRLHDPSQPVAVRPSLDYSYLDKYGSQDFLAPDARQPDGSDHVYDIGHIDYIDHLTTFRGRETSPDGVPCPEALSRRLHNLSPRISTTPSPAPPETVDALGLETAESPDAVSPDTSDTQILTPPGDTQTNAIPPLVLSIPTLLAEKGRDDDVDPGVQEAVRGIYKLWSTTRRGRSGNLDASVEKDLFLEVVRDVLKLV